MACLLEVRWGRANYFIASAHDSGCPDMFALCLLWGVFSPERKELHPRESGELIFWRADTGAEVKRLKVEWG